MKTPTGNQLCFLLNN